VSAATQVASPAIGAAKAQPVDVGVARAALGALGVGILFAAWWLATDFSAAPGSFLARFSLAQTGGALAGLLADPSFWGHVGVSLQRIAIGLGIATLIGAPLGVAVGSSKLLEAATTPAFQLLRMISPLSWMPIAVMAFGVGDKPVYFLLAFAAVWPIVLNTAAGVRGLDARYLQLASSLAATRWETVRRVVAPGIVAHVLTGVRLSIGVSWIILVPCEMLGVTAGLGYFILDARDRLAYPELMATILVIGALGYMLDGAARRLQSAWSRQG
jgi:NitT/TauT family transport system permease protein